MSALLDDVSAYVADNDGDNVVMLQVGIWLGKHKYMARSCDAGTYYQRSFEGSCCVFIVTVVTVSMVYTVRPPAITGDHS